MCLNLLKPPSVLTTIVVLMIGEILRLQEVRQDLSIKTNSQRRVLHMLGVSFPAEISPSVKVAEGVYGLGTVRSLEQFCAFCGVDFAKRCAHFLPHPWGQLCTSHLLYVGRVLSSAREPISRHTGTGVGLPVTTLKPFFCVCFHSPPAYVS